MATSFPFRLSQRAVSQPTSPPPITTIFLFLTSICLFKQSIAETASTFLIPGISGTIGSPPIAIINTSGEFCFINSGVTSPLRSIGAKLDGRNDGDLAPLSIRGASLQAFDYESKIASAQVKSAMILAALRADGTCTYKEPELSRDHTERMLKGMGADISVDGLTTTIKPMTDLLSPLKIRVPADPSSAFFFAVAAAITPGSEVVLEGVTFNPTRIEAFKALERMGAEISYDLKEDVYEPIGNITIKQAPLKAIRVDDNISWLIDELPVLSIAMACAEGRSEIANAEELRVKESDRISTVVDNLKACGIEVEEFEDGYAVTGGTLTLAKVDSFGDHRIAMSFIIAGLRCGMEVSDIDCINTSFPNFFTLLSQITDIKL